MVSADCRDEGELHLAGAEQFADDLHAVEQDFVDDGEGRVGFHSLVQLVAEALAVAVDDAVLEATLDGGGLHFLDSVGRLALGKHLEEALQGVVVLAAAVEDEIFHDLDFGGGNEVQGPDLADVDDGAGHAGPDRVIEEDGVEDRAGGGVEAEGDVGQAEDDLNVGEGVADQLDAFQRPLAELAVILVASGDGEGERVDQQIGLGQAVAVAGKLDEAAGDGELGFGGFGHALLVDGEGDHGGTELTGEDEAIGCGGLAVLEVDRVDDRLAAVKLQRGFEDVRFGAVDDEGGVHAIGEAGDDLVHLHNLIAPDEGGADVEAVGTFGDLFAGNRDAAVPIAALLQFTPFLAAVGVAALTDGEVAVLLAQRRLGVEAGDAGDPNGFAGDRGRAAIADAAEHGVERLDMRRRGAAAAADQVEAVFGDEAFDPGGHGGRVERVVGFAVDEFGQAGVGLDGEETRPVGGEPADVLGHLLRAGCAVEAHERHIERVDDGGGGGDVWADEEGAGSFDGDLDEDGRYRRRLPAGQAWRRSRRL